MSSSLATLNNVFNDFSMAALEVNNAGVELVLKYIEDNWNEIVAKLDEFEALLGTLRLGDYRHAKDSIVYKQQDEHTPYGDVHYMIVRTTLCGFHRVEELVPLLRASTLELPADEILSLLNKYRKHKNQSTVTPLSPQKAVKHRWAL